MELFAEKWNFRHTSCLGPYHQQGNGKVEPTVKTGQKLMKKSVESKTDLNICLLQWRKTSNKVKSSPVRRLFNHNTKNILPFSKSQLKTKIVENVTDKICVHQFVIDSVMATRYSERFSHWTKKVEKLVAVNKIKEVVLQIDIGVDGIPLTKNSNSL